MRSMRLLRPVLFMVLAVIAVLVGAGLGQAQARQSGDPSGVLSGGDLGFRVTGQKDGKPVGYLVVRVDGKWVETASQPTLRLIPTK